jgi:uncharacterized membrane protein
MTTLNTPQDPRIAVDNPMDSSWYRTIPLAAVVLGFVMVAGNYGALPDSIPIHFNGRGEVDGYGSKLMLWILPVINFGVFWLIGLTATSSFTYFNYPVTLTEDNAEEQHRIALKTVALVRLVCCLMISYIIYAIVRSAVTEASQLNMWVMGGFLMLLFAGIGYNMLLAKKAK